MNPSIASISYLTGIAGLFWLYRDRKARPSRAVWIPVVWLFICESRMVSQWLGAGIENTPDQLLEGSPLDRNVFMLLMACGIAVLLNRQNRLKAILLANWPTLVFFSYAALSILWSDYPGVAFKHWIKAIGDLIMVWIVLTDPDWPTALKTLVVRTSFVLVPLSILFIKYYPELGRKYDAWAGTASLIGVTTDKNLLGMASLVMGLGCIWCVFEALQKVGGKRQLRPLIASGTCLTMVIWILWHADSATSKACFLAGGAIMVATTLSRQGRKLVVLHVMVAALISTAFCAVLLSVGTGLVQSMGRDPSLTGRTEVWDRVLSMEVDPLLGAGYDNFWIGKRLEKIWSIYWWHPNEAHNGYIDLYLNLGWVGEVLLAAVVVFGYRAIVAAVKRQESGSALRLAYFVSALIYNLTEAAFKKLHPVGIFFFLAVMAMPQYRPWKKPTSGVTASALTDGAPVAVSSGTLSTGYSQP